LIGIITVGKENCAIRSVQIVEPSEVAEIRDGASELIRVEVSENAKLNARKITAIEKRKKWAIIR